MSETDVKDQERQTRSHTERIGQSKECALVKIPLWWGYNFPSLLGITSPGHYVNSLRLHSLAARTG